jgi:gas vesicle protein
MSSSVADSGKNPHNGSLIAVTGKEDYMSETRCFFFGLGLGVAAGVLMAPRSGVKTRRRLAETAREGQDYITRESMELRNSVVDALDRTKRAAKTTADGIGAALELGKEQLVG